ncbi:sugar diacid recognition domain-containing protein [Sedimentibacter sp.]|uniref:CdaR family transcriptional regulator n=1 Tax=Sedimentibacter sp. TaxID=1960295 RepID=UPI0028B02D0D|nr:sugar diacid recognition domain-containing protein [Sedimentibacter sp.]
MSILEPALAQKFIEKTAKNLEYNINIMNDKGIIIASKDESRVGSFHEVASKMLNGTIDTGIVKEGQQFIGTKPGVNLFIDYKNKHVGVICVTGNPDNVKSFAELVKTSMEAMLEYEVLMESGIRRRGKAERFLYYLLFEENVDFAVANKMADDLELNRELIRVCILIKYDSDYSSKKIIKALTDSSDYSYQDIIIKARNDDVILYKVVGDNIADATNNYKDFIKHYYDDFANELPKEYNKNKIEFYVGSMQKDIDKYRATYTHAQELSLQIKASEGIHYFNDNILNYYRSLATMKAYDNVFHVYDKLFDEEDKKQFVEIVDALYKNNYNVVYSAKALYIHRNTLIFRLNKIKEMLNIDPISNAGDRDFFNELAYYFSRK